MLSNIFDKKRDKIERKKLLLYKELDLSSEEAQAFGQFIILFR